LYHVVLPCILIKNNTIDMFSQINVKDLRQINAKRKRKVYIVYVYVMVNIVYTPYSSFFFQMSVYLGVINRDALRRFSLLSFLLFIYIATVNLKDCNEMQLLIFSLSSLFFLLLLVVLLFFVSYIQRINLNWDDKEKNKRLTRQICLCMLTNFIINIQLLDDIIIHFRV
jgi:hypothetical protein